MNKSLLALSIGLALTSVEASAAVLQTGDRLSIDVGSSWFFSKASGSPLFSPIPTIGEDGITVGPAQGDTGTGSHSGIPFSTDVGAVTQPLIFTCNTGYSFFSTTLGSGSFGGDTASGVDMTSWSFTWNSISAIPMGGCSLVVGGCDADGDGIDDFTDTGVGTFSWSGVYGDSYSIYYTAHIPIGDPSSFGGIQYDLFLTGTVSAVPVPAAAWLFGSGLAGLIGLSRRKGKKGIVINFFR